jgi:acetyl-CoA carboxylase carboxyltransferase component
MPERVLADVLAEHAALEGQVELGGGKARQARQQRLGRLSARERIAALVDPGSFTELGRYVVHRHPGEEALAAHRHPGDGLICGLGRVAGQAVAVYAHDPTVLRGAVGQAGAIKLCRLLAMAGERHLPVVALADSDGARLGEGTYAMDGYGQIIGQTARLRGHTPQLTLACGLCVGAAAYTAALTDVIGMVANQALMFITGSKVAKVVTGEDVLIEDLGGPDVHARQTGICHAILPDEKTGLEWLQRVLGYLVPTRPADDPVERGTPELETIIPVAPRRAYDMRKVLGAVFDLDSITELAPIFAPNLLTALARLGGRSVAVVASQPMALGGCLDIDASRKGAAFVRWTSAAGLPVVTLVDVPGYLPGRKQEAGGVLPHGAELLHAYACAHVPQVCLIVRKNIGAGSVLAFGAQVRLALPTATVAPMGADAAVEVVFGHEPGASERPDAAAEREALRLRWRERYEQARTAGEEGYIDMIVPPSRARHALATALRSLGA